jgi:hypothetical protein
MAVNVSKTKYIIFKSKGRRVELNDDDGIFYDDNDDSEPYDISKKYRNLIEYLMTTPSLMTEPLSYWAFIWTRTYPLTHMLAMFATNYHSLIT